jgi:hypothetical protein
MQFTTFSFMVRRARANIAARETTTMTHDLHNTIALLERTPRALDPLLRGLPEMWTGHGESENTWSVRTVIAHLIHAEHDNWLPRARVIREPGDEKAFPPFARDGHLHYSKDKTLEQLLDEFTHARTRSLEQLRALKLVPTDLERSASHPSFGSVTLAQLLATWAAHDLTHLHQISRIMASQYREAVGPWVRFLGVMQCAGHSESA